MTGGELDLLNAVLDSNFINDGPRTREFEKRVAGIAGCRYGVAVTSGTVAIACALIALGVSSGDEVIVPNLTFIATANAVRLAGGKPVFADVEPRRFTLDPVAVEHRVTAKTKAIITVDVNGRGAAYDWFEPFCQERGIALISDSAEGLGSVYQGRPLGSFGLAGCFSFSPNKIVTTGQGGVVTTNDDDFRQRMLELKDQGRPVRGSGGDDLHPTMGFNFKFTDLQAAVGLAQLDAMQGRMANMARRDRLYAEHLGNLPNIRLCDMEEPGELRLWADLCSDRRPKIEAVFKDAGIGFRNFWHPLHMQTPYRLQEEFPESERISRSGMWLPSHFDVGEEEIVRIANAIRQAIE